MRTSAEHAAELQANVVLQDETTSLAGERMRNEPAETFSFDEMS